jgi:uncharacterized protein (DUF3084 family)
MDIGTKELVGIIGAISGWVAAFTTVKIKAVETRKQLDELKAEHRSALNRLEEALKKEDRILHERIQAKKEMFDEFRDSIKDDLAEIKSENARFLHTDVAEQKFVSKSELKLILDNINLQYTTLSEKIDGLIESLKANMST